MHFIEKLDMAMMVAVTVFFITAILSLIVPVWLSARIVKLFCTLPSAACSSIWIFFFRPVFFLALWCLTHTLSYFWDAAMEYLMYTPKERRLRHDRRVDNAAERCRIQMEEKRNHKHERSPQQKQQRPNHHSQQPSFSPPTPFSGGPFPTARQEVPPLFTGDGGGGHDGIHTQENQQQKKKKKKKKKKKEKTPVAGDDGDTACWPPRRPPTWTQLAAKARRAYPRASWRDDPVGMVDDLMAARRGSPGIDWTTVY